MMALVESSIKSLSSTLFRKAGAVLSKMVGIAALAVESRKSNVITVVEMESFILIAGESYGRRGKVWDLKQLRSMCLLQRLYTVSWLGESHSESHFSACLS